MAFQLANFDVIKQHYDKTGLYHYHETVGTSDTDPTTKRSGDAIATIMAANYFNPVADQLAIGSIIIVSTPLAVNVGVVTGVVDADGDTKIVLTPLYTAPATT